MRKFFNKKTAILLIVVVLIIVGINYYRSSQTENGYEEANLTKTLVKRTVSASGVVKSEQEAELSFSGTGKITYLDINKGDIVDENQYLASLDTFTLAQNIQSAKDARDAAIKDLEIYIENYETNVEAVGGRDEYKLNVAKLRELVSRAEASYQAQLGGYSSLSLYAPFTGTVVDVNYELGETAVAGQPVIKIADLDRLMFEISVDQEDFGLLEEGQKVEIVLDSYEDIVFNGTISSLPFFANENTEEFVIDILLENNQEEPILLGMKGDAEIITDSTDGEVDALLFDTVFEDDQGYYVWILEDREQVKEYVEIGLQGDLYTEVETNLQGKQIIIPENE